MYTTKIKKMKSTIDALEEQLSNATEKNKAHIVANMARAESQAVLHVKRTLLRGVGISLAKCVKLWRKYTSDKKAERKLMIMAGKWSRKHALSKNFRNWFKGVAQYKVEREASMHEAKLETVTREIITRYESELEKLRIGIKAAHEEIARGHVQRQQLEEKMRRTFLKGMTAMNMEALDLFNKAAQSDASFTSAASEI